MMADVQFWHALDADGVVRALKVDPHAGLTRDEAARRLAQYGRNELTRAEKMWLASRKPAVDRMAISTH